MKFAPLLLAASVLVNGVLLARLWQSQRASGPSSAVLREENPAPTAAATRPKQAAVAVLEPEKDSFIAQRDRLLAMGFPSDAVQKAMTALIGEPRLTFLRATNASAASTPWWHRGPSQKTLTPDQEKQLEALTKTVRAEAMRVLGPEALVPAADLERYGFLGKDKALQLALLEQDYADLRRQAASDPTASKSRKDTVEAEYKRDLAALLSPEEKADLDSRRSQTAQNLRTRFEDFDLGDDDYRKLYGLQKTFDDKFVSTASRTGGFSPDIGPAMKDLSAAWKEALGPDRYESYLQAQRPEYRALIELQRRFDVPATSVDQVAQLQREISTAGLAVADDRSLDREAKRVALEALAERGRTGVRTALGADLGDKYLKATSATWVDLLAAGKVYTAQITGGTMTRNAVTTPPPTR